MRVVFILKKPSLGLIDSFSFLCMLQLMISEQHGIFILIPWSFVLWPGRCLGDSFDGSSSGPAVLFPVARAPLDPPACWEHCPPCWVDFQCPSKLLVPLGSFSAMWGDTLGMTGSVSAASPFHFRVVTGEGIACLGVPASHFPLILEISSVRAFQLVSSSYLLLVMGLHFPVSHLNFPPVHKYPPVLLVGSPLQLWLFVAPNPWSEKRDYWHSWLHCINETTQWNNIKQT